VTVKSSMAEFILVDYEQMKQSKAILLTGKAYHPGNEREIQLMILTTTQTENLGAAVCSQRVLASAVGNRE
jgi:hypothetical protein